MKLNYTNAVAKGLLQAKPIGKPQPAPVPVSVPAAPILHFGVGGFHRAHQAWSLQQMLNKDEPGLQGFDDWYITGVCVLPADKGFVEAFREQDCLNFVQSFRPDGERKVSLLRSIREILYVEQDYDSLLSRMAARETKVISFTITEGGYNVDYNRHAFIWDNPLVQEDMLKRGVPKTVFRILAEGLKKRMEASTSAGGIILMSCDNVQHNGAILQFALLEFLKQFDPDLITWIEKNVSFVSTMVDRITPVTTLQQKADFAREQGLEDNCLVVCEDFLQWVIGNDPRLEGLPYAQMGATIVEDVTPYEKMKLRLLNGGHSLTGLLGYALGYDRIHTSISDDLIGRVFRRYSTEEVLPTLAPIEGVSYEDYVGKLRDRFSNPMINDSTHRIISGSTDKLPKFVLPVIEDRLTSSGTDGNGNSSKDGSRDDIAHPQIKWGMLILAAWYYYLWTEYQKNRMLDVQDLNRKALLSLFESPDFDSDMFMDQDPLFATIRDHAMVRHLFTTYTKALLSAHAAGSGEEGDKTATITTTTAITTAGRQFIAALLAADVNHELASNE